MIKALNQRIIEEANYLLNTNKTIREVAKRFSVSKSTIHRDLQEKLFEIDSKLHFQVQKIIQIHLAVRHINGGKATKRKYQELSRVI